MIFQEIHVTANKEQSQRDRRQLSNPGQAIIGQDHPWSHPQNEEDTIP